MSLDLHYAEMALSQMFASENVAGMAVAVTDCKGVIYERGFGVTSVEKPWDKMSPQTLSRIASNTKFTVGLCAMQLVERGKLDLDAPVSQYLPWFFEDDKAVASRITIRKLLNHTSGLPAEYQPAGFRDEDRSEKVLREQLAKVKLIADPDDGVFSYSNFGTRLVACAMEHICCSDFSKLCERMVLQPLGMTTSTFDICRAATYELALPHVRDDAGNLVVDHCIYINATRYAAGGLFSNVHEMTALARVMLNKGMPLLREVQWNQMKETSTVLRQGVGASLCSDVVARESMTSCASGGEGVHARVDAAAHTCEGTCEGAQRTYDYALTLMMQKFGKDGRMLLGHTGANFPYYSCIWTDPDSGYGIAFVTNTQGGNRLVERLIPEFFVEWVSRG